MADCGHGWRSKADCDICTLERVEPQAAARIEQLENALRELLDAFNPEPRISTRLTIWGRAAMALDGTPDADQAIE